MSGTLLPSIIVPAEPAHGRGVTDGYLRTVKTMAVKAIQAAFEIEYPASDAGGGAQAPYCSIEYPVNPADVPGIWVDFEPALLQTSGINYTETDADGNLLTRWRFQGHASFTIAALTSNERDLIYDQLVAMVAFAAQSESPSAFRDYIEGSNLIFSTWSYDQIEGRPPAAAPGTPWGTDDMMYETGLSLQVVGEFVTSPVTRDLVNLREIKVTATSEADGSSFEADITRGAADDPGLGSSGNPLTIGG